MRLLILLVFDPNTIRPAAYNHLGALKSAVYNTFLMSFQKGAENGITGLQETVMVFLQMFKFS